MGQPSSTTISAGEDRVDSPNMLHTLARTWLGGFALAWDELNVLANSPALIVARGEALERTLAERWQRLVQHTRTGAMRLSSTVRSPYDWVAGGVQNSSIYAEEELERQIELALDRLGIPSRERLLQLGDQIDALSDRIEAELARQIA